MSANDNRDLVAKLYGEGYDDGQIAERIGAISRSTVRGLRMQLGLAAHKRSTPKVDPDDVRRLASQGKLDREIAETLDVTVRTVCRVRKANDIPSGQPKYMRVLDIAVAQAKRTTPRPSGPVVRLTDEEAQDAVCAQSDGDAWFPEQGQSNRAAKAICATCPLTRVEDGGSGRCLDVAVSLGDVEGIWAGTSKKERLAMLHSRTEVAA